MTTSLAPAHNTRNNLSSRLPVSLDYVRVAAPCPANWEQMAGDDRVRHCQECNLNVYNLSEMTRLEAERFIASREGRLCVRFYRRADGTILTRDCPKGLHALTLRISKIAGAVLSAMIAVTPLFGQSTAKPSPQPQASSKETQLGIEVMVFDPTNAVIQNAKIRVCRCKDKITYDASTDSSGTAQLLGLAKGDYDVDVQAPGFKPSRETVTIKKLERLKIKLKVAEQTTTIEVKAQPVAIMGIYVEMREQSFPSLPASTGGRPAPLR